MFTNSPTLFPFLWKFFFNFLKFCLTKQNHVRVSSYVFYYTVVRESNQYYSEIWSPQTHCGAALGQDSNLGRAVNVEHRRRMELEDKAKVVASVCGAEIITFLALLAVLPWSIWKKRLNSPYSFKWTKARDWTKSASQTDATTFALSSNSILLLWCRGTLTVSYNTKLICSCPFLCWSGKILLPKQF